MKQGRGSSNVHKTTTPTPPAKASEPRASGPPAVLARLQQAAGNAAVQRLVVQRDAVRLGEVTATTYGQAVEPLVRRTLELGEMAHHLHEGDALRTAARELNDEVIATVTYFRSHETEAMSAHYADQTRRLWSELTTTTNAVAARQREEVQRSLRAAERDVQEALRRMRDEQPRLDRAARQAFLSGDDDLIAQVASWTGFATDVGMGLHEMSRQLAEAIAETRGTTIPPAGRGVEILNTLNRVLAGINLFYSVQGVLGTAPTELATAEARINGIVGTFSAGGTLLNLAPHIGLYTNLYLGPMTQIVLRRVNTILDQHLHGLNEAAGAGVTQVEASSEPGGWPVFTFMWRMMTTEQEPPSVAEAVKEYFFDNRDAIGAATRSAVPIQGFIGFREVNEAEFKPWVFAHRQELWRSFYGAMQVPPVTSVPGAHR